ncbi:YtzI protein [Metabacillus arenae]|uniref:YtzI protein n=1 Tax=Metabacillus arenae TaxID=2771434 RepID=A0A926RWS6_9BACI|nr:YtzI protein [Metabacillus arenae]MBD1380236.1 YtzI protein [Metabacillus arenae]
MIKWLVICIIIVIVILVISLLTTSKAYTYKHTIDALDEDKDQTKADKDKS